jgi:hypothetical protein
MGMGYRFNPPPTWPAPPPGWVPPPGWRPSPEWPAPPPGWQLWVDNSAPAPNPAVSDRVSPLQTGAKHRRLAATDGAAGGSPIAPPADSSRQGAVLAAPRSGTGKPAAAASFDQVNDKARKAINAALEPDEQVVLAIAGEGGAALVATDRRVFVFKKGQPRARCLANN